MQFTKEYVIEDIRQLIDINGDLGIFETNFTIKTENPEDVVDVAIVNQQILDEGSEIDYKNIKGEFSNVFKVEGGTAQGYYLVLKASKPTKLVITVNTIPMNIPPPPESLPSMNNPQHHDIERERMLRNDDRMLRNDDRMVKDKESPGMMKKIFDKVKKNQIYIIGGLIILGIVLYYLYTNGYLDEVIDKYNIPFLQKKSITIVPEPVYRAEYVPEVIPPVVPAVIPPVVPVVIPPVVPELPTPTLTKDSENFLSGLRDLEL